METWYKFPLNLVLLSLAISPELVGLSSGILPSQAHPINSSESLTESLTLESGEHSSFSAVSQQKRVLVSQQEIPNSRWNNFEPPQRGTPGRRDGGGTRPAFLNCPQKLVALVPELAWGGTTDAEPTLFYYVADPLNHTAEFVIEDEAGHEKILNFEVKTKAPGIVALDLSQLEGLGVLDVNQYYQWFFSIKCGPNDNDPTSFAGNPYTQGWIKRVPENYSGSVWYDELGELAEQEQSSSQRMPSLAWATILEEVGLGQYDQQPFIPLEISGLRVVEEN